MAEAAMVVWSFILCHKHYPLPFNYRRMAEYVVVAAAIYALSEVAATQLNHTAWVALNGVLFLAAVLFAIKRERIDVAALCKAAVKKFVR